MTTTSKKVSGGRKGSEFKAEIPPTKWPYSLPHKDEAKIISVLCGNTSIVWAIHEGQAQGYTPECCWRTTHLEEQDLKKGSPATVLSKHIPPEVIDIIFGEDRTGDELNRAAAHEQSRRRKIAPFTVYILATNQTQAAYVAHIFSDIPSRIFQMQPDDFFSQSEGRYDTMGIDRLASLRAVGSMLGFPALVIDGGTCMTYSAADEDGVIMGGGIGIGVQAKLEMLAHKTQSSPGLSNIDPEKIMKQAAIVAGGNKKMDVFARDTESAVLVHLLREIVLTYRNVIKDYLLRIGATRMSRDEEEKNEKSSGPRAPLPKVILAGGSAPLLSQLLQSDHGGIVSVDPTIPAYQLSSIKHVMAYGVSYALQRKQEASKEKKIDALDLALMGKRVAKEFSQADEDSETIYRGTVAAAVRERHGDDPSYLVRYDDNDTEEMSLLDLHRALKLYSSVGEKQIRREKPTELEVNMTKGKVVASAAAAKQLESRYKLVNEAPKIREPDVRPVATVPAPRVPKPKTVSEVRPVVQPKAVPRVEQKPLKPAPKVKRPPQQAAVPKQSPAKKPKKEKLPTEFIGARIAKLFDEDGLYFGKITGYDEGYWKVVYDDGDEEEFDKNDLESAVRLYAKKKKEDSGK